MSLLLLLVVVVVVVIVVVCLSLLLGKTAKNFEPVIEQAFIAADGDHECYDLC